MELYDVLEPRRIFVWAKEAVEEDIQGVLNSLRTRTGNEIRYPGLREMQAAIEDYMHITENDKCAVLKSLKINNDETLKKFNYKYKKLYQKLSHEYRRLISVKDYTNAISTRVFPCSRVMIAECETLNEAFKIAEIAEEAEKEISSANIKNGYEKEANIMVTQSYINNGNPLLNHPFYENLNYNQLSTNYNPNISRNEDNSFITTNNRNYGQNMRTNNFRNQNYVNYMVNPYNNINKHNNNYNNNNNIRGSKMKYYNNNQYMNNNNNQYMNNNNNQYMNNNNNQYMNNNNNQYMNMNNNQYMNMNNNYHMNNMSRNYSANERRGNININNSTNNNMTNNIPDNYMNKRNNNNIHSFNYQNDNNYQNNTNKVDNTINTMVTAINENNPSNGATNMNNNISNNFGNNTFNNNINNNYICYRCTLRGHKSSNCPYTFKQLAEMEEKGLIKLPLNQ
ncbi:hypothetical protein BCR32DRAFT_288496 [Anaeromyces robustus]|uniref:CCHC-type domain-containing protein n=1 Tax=Anaeromyces robustus TaxID=1754192 RepID=A0A1Y1UTN6_9FUNG|nr:hypothetical protein BCR32DRAFT_288496 [Anaeromyces robustus]|eukprot:ORX41390.1 hypothetical protein BCR32DRAFT_288496 [Anaeromyces robustus]